MSFTKSIITFRLLRAIHRNAIFKPCVRWLQYKAANMDPLIKEQLMNELYDNWQRDIKAMKEINPRNDYNKSILSELSNVSSKVSSSFEIMNETLLKQFLRPSKLDFRVFCSNVETRDDVLVLQELIKLIHFSKKPLETGETSRIFRACIEANAPEVLIEMLLERNIYGLQPTTLCLRRFMNYLSLTCKNAFDMGENELYKDAFIFLLQIFPLFPDYLLPTPSFAFEFAFDAASVGDQDAFRIASSLAKDKKTAQKQFTARDYIFLIKGGLLCGEENDALGWIEEFSASFKNPAELSDDELFMRNLFSILLEKNKKFNGKFRSDSVFLRNDRKLVDFLCQRLQDNLTIEQIQALSDIANKPRLA